MVVRLKQFIAAEEGAVSVDWVMLTAAVLGVLFGALTTFNQGVSHHASLTSSTLEALDIPTY